ncbi:galactose-3-O-sulfotransferase 3-like [Glandiceps talaboti]
MMTIFHKGKSYIGNLETYLIHGENSPGASLPVMGTRREDRTLVARTGQTLNFAAVSPMQVKVIERAPQTILLSIVREPAANFESAFNFFNLYKYVNKHPSSNPGEKIKEFLQKPEYYRNKVSKGRNWCVARNGQAWHLGLDHKYHDREDIVEEYFSRLANELDLVFVTEYYDHSLILLKRIMCWKMENILYIARRVRSKRTPLTQDMKDKIRNWNYVDVKLYQIFNRTLWSKIDQYGPEFDNDLQDFRQLRDAVSKDCNLHKTLIKETIQLLAKHGSHVTDSRKFCMKLLAWFTMDDGLELAGGSHGIGAYTSLVKGTKDPLGSFKSENAGNGEQCIKVYYHKAISSKDRKSLDIYISKMGSNISNIEVQNTTNGSYVASYTTGEWEYFQVTTHVKYATDGYLIDALSMTNGRCDD